MITLFVALRIEHSQFNRIEFNEIKGNGRGIQFDFTGANVIRNNNITSSTITEIDLSLSLGDLITKNNIDNSQLSLVLLQINFGLSDGIQQLVGINTMASSSDTTHRWLGHNPALENGSI